MLKQKRFITLMVTQKAIASDDPVLDETLGDQALSGSERPTELYVDGAYVSAARLQEVSNESWELIGPAQSCRSGQCLRIEAGNIDITKRRTRCPSGFLSTQCSRMLSTINMKLWVGWGSNPQPTP
jgi:hypothetical protein